MTDIAPKDEEGQTPLHVAAKHGQLEAIQYLAAKGTDNEPKTQSNQSPYDLAVMNNQPKAVQVLQAIQEGICKFTYRKYSFKRRDYY